MQLIKPREPFRPKGQKGLSIRLNYGESPTGLDEEQIRKYVKWQEKREKRLEVIQGKLFD